MYLNLLHYLDISAALSSGGNPDMVRAVRGRETERMRRAHDGLERNCDRN